MKYIYLCVSLCLCMFEALAGIFFFPLTFTNFLECLWLLFFVSTLNDVFPLEYLFAFEIVCANSFSVFPSDCIFSMEIFSASLYVCIYFCFFPSESLFTFVSTCVPFGYSFHCWIPLNLCLLAFTSVYFSFGRVYYHFKFIYIFVWYHLLFVPFWFFTL